MTVVDAEKGAFGSLLAQFMRCNSAERKTLLVAGVAGGMSATFASPVRPRFSQWNCPCSSGSHAVSSQWRWRVGPRLPCADTCSGRDHFFRFTPTRC